MKKFLIPIFLFSVVFLISAAPPILRQFGTTNTPTALTNIIQSLAGSGSSTWTNNGTYVALSNGFAIRNSDHTVGDVNTFTLDPDPAGVHSVVKSFLYPQRGDTTNYLFSFGSQANTNSYIYSTFTFSGNAEPGSGFSQDFSMFISGYTNNSVAEIIVATDKLNTKPVSELFLQAGSDSADDIVLLSKPGESVIAFGNVFSVVANGTIDGLKLTLNATTNQIVFGKTNTAPVSAVAPTKWISVQVKGETAIYRLPLYE